MPSPIIYQRDQGLAQGISQAGSALGGALGQIGMQERAEQQRQMQRQEQLDLLAEQRGRQQASVSGLADLLRTQGIDLGPQINEMISSGNYDPTILQEALGLTAKPFFEQKFKPPAKPEISPAAKIVGEARGKHISENLFSNKPQEALALIDRIDELAEGLTGLTGYAKAAWNSEDAAEFNALGLAALEPVLKIYNPVGALPTRKIEMIKELYAPNAWDNAQTIKGKSNALRAFAKRGIENQQKIRDLQQLYGDDIPTSALLEYEKQVTSEVDDILRQQGLVDEKGNIIEKATSSTSQAGPMKSMPSPMGNQGRFVLNQETGKKYLSNGRRWVEQKG